MSTIRVKVSVLGTGTKTLEVDEGSTVGDVLDQADADVNNKSILLNGSNVALDRVVEEDDTVTVSPNVQGG